MATQILNTAQMFSRGSHEFHLGSHGFSEAIRASQKRQSFSTILRNCQDFADVSASSKGPKGFYRGSRLPLILKNWVAAIKKRP